MDDFDLAKPVSRDPRYAVTPSGNIYRVAAYEGKGARNDLPHLMTPLMMGVKGRRLPYIRFGHGTTPFPVGRLVLEAFGEPEPWSGTVQFITEDRTNASLDNVRWRGVDVDPALRASRVHAVAVAPRLATEQPASVEPSPDAGACK